MHNAKRENKNIEKYPEGKQNEIKWVYHELIS